MPILKATGKSSRAGMQPTKSIQVYSNPNFFKTTSGKEVALLNQGLRSISSAAQGVQNQQLQDFEQNRARKERVWMEETALSGSLELEKQMQAASESGDFEKAGANMQSWYGKSLMSASTDRQRDMLKLRLMPLQQRTQIGLFKGQTAYNKAKESMAFNSTAASGLERIASAQSEDEVLLAKEETNASLSSLPSEELKIKGSIDATNMQAARKVTDLRLQSGDTEGAVEVVEEAKEKGELTSEDANYLIQDIIERGAIFKGKASEAANEEIKGSVRDIRDTTKPLPIVNHIMQEAFMVEQHRFTKTASKKDLRNGFGMDEFLQTKGYRDIDKAIEIRGVEDQLNKMTNSELETEPPPDWLKYPENKLEYDRVKSSLLKERETSPVEASIRNIPEVRDAYAAFNGQVEKALDSYTALLAGKGKWNPEMMDKVKSENPAMTTEIESAIATAQEAITGSLAWQKSKGIEKVKILPESLAKGIGRKITELTSNSIMGNKVETVAYFDMIETVLGDYAPQALLQIVNHVSHTPVKEHLKQKLESETTTSSTGSSFFRSMK